MYLLIINFVRVLIVYFQNIVYYNKFHYQLRKNCTYLLHSMDIAITVYTFFLYMNLHIAELFIPHFVNASTDTVSYAVRDLNILTKGEVAFWQLKNKFLKLLLNLKHFANF